MSLHSSQDTCPCFHQLYISFLVWPACLDSAVLVLPSFPDFSHLGIKNSCILWKASLKICQLYSAPLSLRAVSQGVLLTNSFKSCNFAFLKFRDLTSLFAWPISLGSANSTSVWSLLPRLPPVLTSLISSLVLVTNRSSVHPTVLGLSITWLNKLSSMHSRSLLDCLQLSVLLFQQMSGQSPSRTRACEHHASCSWSKKNSSVCSPWSGGL